MTGSWKREFGEKTIRKRELKLKIQREGGIEAKMQRDEGRSIYVVTFREQRIKKSVNNLFFIHLQFL